MKATVPIDDPNVNRTCKEDQNQSNIKSVIEESQGHESEFLSPMFDLSDAPILNFSNFSSTGSSTDPSSLISKVLAV